MVSSNALMGGRPHFVLVSDAEQRPSAGIWRFELRAVDGSTRFAAADLEPHMRGDRLQLLAVLRGLEALERPSYVTLVTKSGYVREGIRHGLAQWRADRWRWERFGQMVPVKHSDLWQRIDQALRFHRVECRPWRVEGASRDESLCQIAGRIVPRDAALEEVSDHGGAQPPLWKRLFSWLRKAA